MTHVSNNLQVNSGIIIWGIFVVDGSISLAAGATVNGVIYLPNATTTTITGSGTSSTSTVYGGIVSHGNITTTGSNVSVKHNPTYMRAFCQYLLNPSQSVYQFVSWTY